MMRPGVIACLLFLLAFGLYLHRAFPTLSVGDSGEFITAASTLGILHPSGYPTYTILANSFIRIIPFGNPGFKANLFSVVAGALTVAILYFTLHFLGLLNPAAVFGGALYMVAASQITISQASEVFALHMLFIAGSFYATFRRRWMLLGLLLGLALGNHQTVLFMLPAILAGFLYSESRASWRDLWRPGLFVIMGLSIYGVLFLRAQKSPFLNVGHPDSLERLWRVITRADYGSLTLSLGDAPARTAENAWAHLVRFFGGLLHEISWIGIVLAAVGSLAWFRRDRRAAWILIFAFVLFGPFFFWLGNLPFDAQSAGLLGRFYAAPVFCLAALSAGAVQWVGEKTRSASWLFLLLPLTFLVTRSQADNFRHHFESYSYGRNTLHSLPHGTVFFMDGGDDTFYAMAYLTQAEKRRPDLELYDRGGVVFANAYGPDFRSLPRDQKELRRRVTERAFLEAGRPLYYSTMNSAILPGVNLNQSGIVYGAGHAPSSDLWSLYDLRGIPPWMASSREPVNDYRRRALIPFYAYQRGIYLAHEQVWDQAIGYLQCAHAIGGDVLWLVPNLIVVGHFSAFQALQGSHLSLAQRLYQMVLQWSPRDATAWTNLGAAEERLGRLPEAVRDYEKAVTWAPQSVTAHFNLATGFWKESRWKDAAQEFAAVLAIDPQYPSAQQFLDLARQHVR